MIRYILTHPGGAHKDELLAVCVLIAKYGVDVVRREPTQEELRDDMKVCRSRNHNSVLAGACTHL